MMFTTEQIAQFRDQGYLAVPDFWTKDEVGAMQSELIRLKKEGKLRNVATEGDGKTQSQSKANLQLCPMSPHSDLFRALPFAPKVGAAIRELIGDPVVLHLDQVFLKPAGHGAGTNWHQDNAYFQIDDPMKGTAMWTAVHDANLANGTIRVIPGSYKEKLEHSRDPQSDHHVRCYPDESKTVPIELPAGGVVFFAYGVAHSTGGNATEMDRAGAAFHFLNGGSIPPEYFGSHDEAIAINAQRHPILSGPDSSDGSREYGIPIAGTWEREVARCL